MMCDGMRNMPAGRCVDRDAPLIILLGFGCSVWMVGI